MTAKRRTTSAVTPNTRRQASGIPHAVWNLYASASLLHEIITPAGFEGLFEEMSTGSRISGRRFATRRTMPSHAAVVGSRLRGSAPMRDVAAFTQAPTNAGLRDDRSPSAELEAYRSELTGYCYRMLGSPFEAEDAVQETLVRAWLAADRFEGRSSMRTWLYQIATNVCIDALRSRQRRTRPMDLGPASPASATLPPPLPDTVWIEPIPDARVAPTTADPAEVAVQRDSVRLAFVAALQHLPARQRAVLILRDVLRWQAAEVAELLESTAASVNSALQRARTTLSTLDVADTDTFQPLDEAQQSLLARYVDAFERYDLDALTALLHEDVVQSMPPYGLWLRGHDDLRGWYLGAGIGCRGSRLVPTAANESPAFGQYRPAPDGGHEPWSLQVIEISDGTIVGLNAFLDTERLFPLFGLPPRLGA